MICRINGVHYGVRLPMDFGDKGNEWDSLYFATRGEQEVMHWDRMYSLILKQGDTHPFCPLRGYDAAQYEIETGRNEYGSDIGLRLVLVPLNPETWEHDPSLLPEQKEGSVIRMGALFMDSEPVRVPLFPEDSTLCDMVEYKKGASLCVADAEGEENTLTFIVLSNGVLMGDRCILTNISFEDAEAQGLTNLVGKKFPRPRKDARYKELLDAVINHMIDAEGGHVLPVIDTLLDLGFTKRELVNTFKFNEKDVNRD